MKKILALSLALFATTALANVDNSKHDIGSYTNSGGKSVCYYCHVPHNSLSWTLTPLWAKNNEGTTYTQIAGTVNGTVPSAVGNTPSRACMACHDGTMDMASTVNGDLNGTYDLRVGTATGTYTTTANPNAVLGTDLTNDHPIGVTWVSNSTTGLVASAPSTFPLFSNELECNSCHDPHRNVAPSAASGLSKMFMRDPGSDFCAACHANK